MRAFAVVSILLTFALAACEDRPRPARSPAPLEGAPIDGTDGGTNDVDAAGAGTPTPSVRPGPDDIKI